MIQQSSTFSPAGLKFCKLRKNRYGGKIVYLDEKVNLQLPFMRAPFGLSSFTNQSTGQTTYSLDLSLDPDDDLKAKLTELDDLVVKTVAENSTEWLGKELSIETLKQALYTPIVRPGKGYPDTIKLKVLTAPAPECYTTEKEPTPLDEIEKGQRAMAIIEFNSIWFVDSKFGVSLRLQQVMVEPSAKLPAFAFNT